MNNNNLGRVSVRTSKRKRQPTPMAYDVNATASVGEILPFMVREVEPDASVTLKTRNLIRLATMVVPTYGRLKLNLRHYFVGLGDLTENFGALLAEQTVARGKYSFRPTSLPYMSKGFLSLFSLVGSHVTLYRFSSDAVQDTLDDMGAERYKVAFGTTDFNHAPYNTILNWFVEDSYGDLAPDAPAPGASFLNDNKFYTQHMPEFMRDAWGGYDGPALNIAKLIPDDGTAFPADSPAFEFWIPIENKSWETFFELRPNEYVSSVPEYYDTSIVPLDTADAVISVKPKVLGDHYCFLASRFSSFGSRWYNLLISSGLGVDYADFTADGWKSIMPLFAYYKAYWESFGLTLYRKWETSATYTMMQYYDHFNDADFDALISSTAQATRDSSIVLSPDVPPKFFELWCNFVMDVCTAFYTEEQDFVSAHTRTATVTPTAMDAPIPDANSPAVDNNVHINPISSQPSSVVPNYGLPYINGDFSQLDLETLKRLYKVVNRNTIAGQRIATLLELQGLGDYVNSCKSRFIGEHNVDIDIDEVTATSDFFDSEGDPRSLLGEQGGKGVGFGISKKFKVSTREFGYYIVLASVVPEAGYVNVCSASGRNLKKSDFYNPEYDGLGMELNPLELTVAGVQDFSDSSEAKKLSGIGFGFVPRYSRHKVQSNLAIGGFAKRSERTYYRTYFMDKIIDVGERSITRSGASTDNRELFIVHKLAKTSLVPLSSPDWRFIGRYPWLENYLRIFAETGDPRRNNYVYYRNLSDFSNLFFDFCFRDDGKFILQNRMILNVSAPWLKITDAYETKEDGNVGSTDTSIGKA